MKKQVWTIKVIFGWSICLLLLSCATKGPGRVSLNPESKKFLDYVSYIILPVEEKIFREMPSEDRGDFIKDFWARRDPDLSTPANEFRNAYYTRLATADKAFRVGKPGWKTDRGRIYILLGQPTNIITKSMGDVPYEQGKFFKANPIETGTLTERPTEIWVYDNYPEYFDGPGRLVFVDYNSTGDYKLTTKMKITPFSLVSPTWDEPNLAKYHWLGEIEMGKKSFSEVGIFDYDVYIKVIPGLRPSASVLIDIPCTRMDYEKKEGKYSCDLLLSVEIKDSQKRTLVGKEEPFSQVLTKEKLKRTIADKMQIHKKLELDLAPESKFIYVSVIDNVSGKKLRKLLQINF